MKEKGAENVMRTLKEMKIQLADLRAERGLKVAHLDNMESSITKYGTVHLQEDAKALRAEVEALWESSKELCNDIDKRENSHTEQIKAMFEEINYEAYDWTEDGDDFIEVTINYIADNDSALKNEISIEPNYNGSYAVAVENNEFMCMDIEALKMFLIKFSK